MINKSEYEQTFEASRYESYRIRSRINRTRFRIAQIDEALQNGSEEEQLLKAQKRELLNHLLVWEDIKIWPAQRSWDDDKKVLIENLERDLWAARTWKQHFEKDFSQNAVLTIVSNARDIAHNSFLVEAIQDLIDLLREEIPFQECLEKMNALYEDAQRQVTTHSLDLTTNPIMYSMELYQQEAFKKFYLSDEGPFSTCYIKMLSRQYAY